MLEVYSKLFVGSQEDYQLYVEGKPEWKVVQACKEPYHREALGYTELGAPKNHTEYLYAIRSNRLILNLVDPQDSKYIPKECIDKALEFIDENLGNKILIHCNKGQSRSAGITLLFLAKENLIPNTSFEEAEEAFEDIYWNCFLSKGIRDFLIENWKNYIKD